MQIHAPHTEIRVLPRVGERAPRRDQRSLDHREAPREEARDRDATEDRSHPTIPEDNPGSIDVIA